MNDLLPGILANIILYMAGYLKNRIGNFLSKKDPRFYKFQFVIFCGIWLVGSAYLFNYVKRQDEQFGLYLFFFIIYSIIFFYFFWKDMNQFWDVGIVCVDEQIIRGVDFEKSLKLCNSQFSFLGIGASKLVNSKEFENAMDKCTQNYQAKILLLDPSNASLTLAAKRANKPVDKYKDLVVSSLEMIAHFKTRRGLDIEVRFYPENPLFRLMFIDNAICLLSSYTVFGKDDGSKVPQIHLKNLPGSKNTNSLFIPMQRYFNDLWEKSEKWDFKKYIN